jgi:hypothetical protein
LGVLSFVRVSIGSLKWLQEYLHHGLGANLQLFCNTTPHATGVNNTHHLFFISLLGELIKKPFIKE